MNEGYRQCTGRNASLLCLCFLIVIALILTGGCTSSQDIPKNQSSVQAASVNEIPDNNTTISPTVPALSASPYDYRARLPELPEIRSGDMDPATAARYRDLIDTLNKKDPGAAQWAVGMGLFAEDRKISGAENKFVDVVVKKDDPMRILVTKWAMDGVGDSEAGWAADASFPAGDYGYLTDDMQVIESAKGPVDPKAKEALKSIISTSAGDYELRKGLYLIDEYGVPDKTRFTYPVPAYNTQLSVLLDLLNTSDVSPGYYRVALAAGIDYGAVETIGNPDVRAYLPGYVKDQVAYTVETDRLLKEKGVSWQAADYPLEADMILLWGAAGTMRPYPYTRNDEKYPPDYQPWKHPSWESEFYHSPMEIADFEWSFVSLTTLREMRDEMVQHGILPTLTEYIAAGYKGKYNEYRDVKTNFRSILNTTAGTQIYSRDRTNVNLDWENYQKTGVFDSACYSGDLFFHGVDENACYDKPLDEKTLSRSVNVAALLGAAVKDREDGVTITMFTHIPVLFTFDSNGSVLSAYPGEKSVVDKYNRAISHHTHIASESNRLVLENIYYAFVQIPWSNYADRDLFSKVYMDGISPTIYPNTAKGGFIPATDALYRLPSGYLFRNPIASVIDYEKV
ncbi:MAG: hypothetical protein WC391_09210 [Methanoregula sp.]